MSHDPGAQKTTDRLRFYIDDPEGAARWVEQAEVWDLEGELQHILRFRQQCAAAMTGLTEEEEIHDVVEDYVWASDLLHRLQVALVERYERTRSD